MKKEHLSQSGFFNPRILLGLVLGSIGILLVLIGFGMSSGTSVLAQNQSALTPGTKIAPGVLAETANGKSASVVIFLANQADVSAAYAMRDQDARGWFVYNTLTQHAARTQAGLQAFLTARGASYQSFWAANMLVATANRSLVESLAARGDVARVDSNKPARWIEDPAIANFQSTPDDMTTVEWGVTNVNAPAVWALGFTGQGMVIGDMDTGMRWTHNALKPKYRGWDGTTADHNYNWHDAIHSGGGVCGANTVAPCDDSGHGTHTAGTTVGDDGTGHQVGVAPGAKLIGCRNMNVGDGTPATYTECFQFMIAPTDLAGSNANPALRPHVVNNSWGCPVSEGCVTGGELETIVNNTQAAGIFVEVSAGNAGPNCSTVNDAPAIYSASFSTGAIDINNNLANFSSRGPSTFYTPNLLKPNVSAPGVGVRSSYYSSDTSFGTLSGTSMAGPHVVGVVALLWSAHPALVRDIDATKSILQNTANPAVNVSTQTCGGTPSTQIPNNTFGYGRVDALAALNPSPLGNISTRLRVETADNVLIGGVIITGTDPKNVLIRAIGPSLSSILPGALADPILELHGPGTFATITNDNWRSDQEAAITATGLAPTNNFESAILATLPANNSAYTAIVRGVNDQTGIGLVEVYDLDHSVNSKLANISTRGLVQTGDNVLIAGTIVFGQTAQRVLVRAIGPSLTLPGKLADPTLELRDQNGGLVRSNDNWRVGGQEAEIIATGLAPTDNNESAIIAMLPSNGAAYTAIVRGVNNTTGVAVAEVYSLN